MARGGRRQGAGRPKGTGSPLRALKNLRAAERSHSNAFLRDLVGTDDDPAKIALALARDPKIDARLRIDCALGLVPFVHPRLSHTMVESTNINTSVTLDPVSLLAELETRLSRLDAKRDAVTIEHENAATEKAA